VTLTWAARVGFVALLHYKTITCSVELIKYLTGRIVLVVGVHVLECLVEAEIWQNNEEYPFYGIADFDYVERRQLQYENDKNGNRS
jgi:hypothetical protein